MVYQYQCLFRSQFLLSKFSFQAASLERPHDPAELVLDRECIENSIFWRSRPHQHDASHSERFGPAANAAPVLWIMADSRIDCNILIESPESYYRDGLGVFTCLVGEQYRTRGSSHLPGSYPRQSDLLVTMGTATPNQSPVLQRTFFFLGCRQPDVWCPNENICNLKRLLSHANLKGD